MHRDNLTLLAERISAQWHGNPPCCTGTTSLSWQKKSRPSGTETLPAAQGQPHSPVRKNLGPVARKPSLLHRDNSTLLAERISAQWHGNPPCCTGTTPLSWQKESRPSGTETLPAAVDGQDSVQCRRALDSPRRLLVLPS